MVLYSAPLSTIWMAPRVSGFRLENSSSVSKSCERIWASIVSAWERRGLSKRRYLPITLFDKPEDLAVARMVTLLAITRDSANLGKDTLAEAFEG
jgi:hypothetical protein